MMNKNSPYKVQVVIPIYKADLSTLEMRSLQQAYSMLSSYPLVVIKPESLDLFSLSERFPLLTFKSFDDSFFADISGYNRLMLSDIFYGEFLDTEYILIHQLDAYVFRDELLIWVNKGYDYIGAPWLKKPVYNLPGISAFMQISLWYNKRKGKENKQLLYNKIGNGGFSLRRTKSHYDATKLYRERIHNFLNQSRNHLFNEDVFWATVPDFNYPTVMEALHFSFDKYPKYCFKLTNKQLPFGCHGWYKRKMKSFWRPIIHF